MKVWCRSTCWVGTPLHKSVIGNMYTKGWCKSLFIMITCNLCKQFGDLLGPDKLQARCQEDKHSQLSLKCTGTQALGAAPQSGYFKSQIPTRLQVKRWKKPGSQITCSTCCSSSERVRWPRASVRSRHPLAAVLMNQ